MDLGADDEQYQVLHFNVTTTNTSDHAFKESPGIFPNGTFHFCLAQDWFGPVFMEIFARDNGGSNYGGSDQSSTQSVSFDVLFVNQPPTFELEESVSLLENSVNHSVTVAYASFARNITVGPDIEVQKIDQDIHFTVQLVDGDAFLFTSNPSISSNGNLLLSLAPFRHGSAFFSVIAQDTAGTERGGSNTSITRNFSVVVAPVNQRPTFRLPVPMTISSGSISRIMDQQTFAFQIEKGSISNYEGLIVEVEMFSSSRMVDQLPIVETRLVSHQCDTIEQCNITGIAFNRSSGETIIRVNKPFVSLRLNGSRKCDGRVLPDLAEQRYIHVQAPG
jgi:hypothetical protein